MIMRMGYGPAAAATPRETSPQVVDLRTEPPTVLDVSRPRRPTP